MNVYDYQELERQSGQLKKILSQDDLTADMSNAIIREQFSDFFYRQYGAVLGSVESHDKNMEFLFKTWASMVSLPVSVWSGAWSTISSHV
mgnify:CR=1 FL=1|tara:strand:+ start:1359 stop:1628 length:270 start_codon:yes stop_codon:yes gene_type:complete